MTNGEKIKEIFPNGVLTSINNSYYWGDDILVSKKWWNAEYKKPTTKNDLGVDCIVDVLGSYTDLDIPYKREIAENILANLPSITPQGLKTGHWTDDGYCSCCNKQTFPLDVSGYASGYDSFCPNCGAKMESEG